MRLPDGFQIREADMRGPLLRWTTAWSPVPTAFAMWLLMRLDVDPARYRSGLWLVNNQGGGLYVPDAGPELVGISVMAYTGPHALHTLTCYLALNPVTIPEPV